MSLGYLVSVRTITPENAFKVKIVKVNFRRDLMTKQGTRNLTSCIADKNHDEIETTIWQDSENSFKVSLGDVILVQRANVRENLGRIEMNVNEFKMVKKNLGR